MAKFNIYEGPARMTYKGKELKPGTPESIELAQKIWTTLAELVYKEHGMELGEIEFSPAKKTESA